jgi:hypothetical protein
VYGQKQLVQQTKKMHHRQNKVPRFAPLALQTRTADGINAQSIQHHTIS